MLNRKIAVGVSLPAMAFALSATASFANSNEGTVTASVLNVRSGPSTSYSVTTKIYKGNKVEILETSNGWHKIKTSNGTIGWASGSYISVSSGSTSQTSYKATVTATSLNVRSGASTSYSVITKLSKGTVVDVIESASNGWKKIKTSGGTTGWVSGSYLTTGALEDSSTDNSTSQTSYKATVTATSLNVRSGASTSYSIITKLSKGTVVDVIESASNGWKKIKTSGETVGWVSGSYLKTGVVEDSSTDNSTSSYKATVTADSLNVRKGAGTSYSIITKLSKGTVVDVIESASNGWKKIKTSGETVGWVSGSYLKTGVVEDSSTDNSTSSYKATVTADSLNVRKGAGTSYSIITKLSKGTVVDVIESASNGWKKIKTSGETVGWVSGSYLKTGVVEDSSTPSTNKVQAVLDLAEKQLGKPYVWGAEGPNSFDCSGLTYYVYKNAAGITLPRTSSAQYGVGVDVSKSNLQAGDLIFSSTDGTGNITHVAIYAGNGQMIHAPRAGMNVEKVSINNSYWRNAYIGAKRVL
nr:SH3 domain-containing protein [uncultured Romboutsia sp.]